MAKINNFIDLNGKRYDARTGDFLGSGSKTHVSAKQTAHVSPVHLGQNRVMDGVIRPSAETSQPVPSTSVSTATRDSEHLSHYAQHNTKTLAPHKPQHSKTLMRHAVKAPNVRAQRPLHAQAPTDMVKFTPAVMGVQPKLSSEHVDPARAERAVQIPQSRKVVHFQHSELPARRTAFAPPGAVRTDGDVAPATIQVARAPSAEPEQHDMFEQAIAQASSHEQPPHRESHQHRVRRGVRRHMRAVSISAAVLAVLLLGGFVAYQNKVELELQLASARAGFPAGMPGYEPAGYAAKSLHYGPGNVVIGYSGPSNQTYKLIQKSSNWDSETLLQNYVATSGQAYQAYSAGGRTVYVYGNGNATWVNGGIWYQVSSNGNLSKDQIIDLVTSI